MSVLSAIRVVTDTHADDFKTIKKPIDDVVCKNGQTDNFKIFALPGSK